MNSILLAELADRFDIEVLDAADIIKAAGGEVLPDINGDLHAIENEAIAALFAAGRFPIVRGVDAAAPAITFSTLEAIDDDE